MISVIFIQSLLAVIFLLIKRALLCFYKDNPESFDQIKNSYYWFEYVYFFTATIVTPKHTWNEGILTLFSVILIKVIIDRIKGIDVFFCRVFKK